MKSRTKLPDTDIIIKAVPPVCIVLWNALLGTLIVRGRQDQRLYLPYRNEKTGAQ